MARSKATKGPLASSGKKVPPFLQPKKRSREMTQFELELEASRARMRKRQK